MLVTLSPVCRHEQLPEFPCRLFIRNWEQNSSEIPRKVKEGRRSMGEEKRVCDQSPCCAPEGLTCFNVREQ